MVNRAFLTGFCALLLASIPALAQTSLKGYVEREDDSYKYEIVSTEEVNGATIDTVRMTSQTWQDIEWKHYLSIVTPPEVEFDTSIIHIAGGNNNSGAPSANKQEVQVLSRVAALSRSAVAVLWQVPNQPLFDGRNEDEIIAYTYDKYLQGEGDDWPLLYPMVKSAVRAMDTLASVQAEKGNTIERFVLTGGSKRGWTSWLGAAVDDRVRAIAPVVIDVLNMEVQMEHMMATYGGYSNQIDDYTELRIQERSQTPEGQVLSRQVDPFYHLDNIDVPVLVINGANDPYWTVDASQFYFPHIKGEKRIFYQANTGHDISINGIATLSEWYISLLEEKPFPELTWETLEGGRLKVSWDKEGGTASLVTATSTNRDFRDQTWVKTPLEGDQSVVAKIEAPEEGWLAYYVEVNWPAAFGLPFGVTTTMHVTPDNFPTENRAYDATVAASEEER